MSFLTVIKYIYHKICLRIFRNAVTLTLVSLRNNATDSYSFYFVACRNVFFVLIFVTPPIANLTSRVASSWKTAYYIRGRFMK